MRVTCQIPKVGPRDQDIKLVKKAMGTEILGKLLQNYFNFMSGFTSSRRILTFNGYIGYKTITSQRV